MTVSSTQSIVVYEGNGASTTFDFDFLIPSQDDMVVTYTDTAGTETVLSTSQYSVTGIDDPDGGTVTYPLSGSPIANNTFLSIRRELPLTQTTDLVNQDGFYPQVVENALDTLCMQIQQISTLNSQAIRVPASENPPNELPAAVLRANQSLVFDTDGQPTVGSPSNATVSAAMQPVVAAATTAASRALYGVAYLPSAVTTNQTVTLANITTRYMATGALNFTMPDTTQVPAGFSFSVWALTAGCTLTPQATDTIYGYSMGGAASVSAGTIVEAVTDGAGNWWLATLIATEDFVGRISPYAGFLPPSAKYKICDGTSYLRADFPACFAAISLSLTVTKTSGSPVLGGFTADQTSRLCAGMLVEGTGIPAGSTILTTPGAGDTSITLDHNATNSLSQTAIIIPWGAADTTHFNVPDFRGRTIAGAEQANNAAARLTSTYFGANDRIGQGGGNQRHQLIEAELPIITPNGTVSKPNVTIANGGNVVNITAGTGSNITSGGGGLFFADVTAALATNPIFTGTPFGADGFHTNVQPTAVANFLIRVLP